MGLLDGKVAIVTGAGGGIGKEHAKLLAAEGAAVVVNDLGVQRDGTGAGELPLAEAVAREIREAGGQAVANMGSVTDAEQVAAMVAQAVETFGKLDILIANAGILRDKTFKKMTPEMWDLVIDVHLRGTYLSVYYAYQQLLAQKSGGRIVVTSSTSGLYGNFGQCNYGAAKAGVAGLMRCLWPEAQRNGITVNALAPVALTRLTEDLPRFGGPDGMGQQMKPNQVSPAVVWLCTDAAAEVTGRTFLVYGNTVKLIEPTLVDIAEKPEGQSWSVAEVGAAINASLAGRDHPRWM